MSGGGGMVVPAAASTGGGGSWWGASVLSHLSASHASLPSGVHLDPNPTELSAPPQEVWAHADYEVAQTQLEVVQAMAMAKMEAAKAKRAVVHAHVPPNDSYWLQA